MSNSSIDTPHREPIRRVILDYAQILAQITIIASLGVAALTYWHQIDVSKQANAEKRLAEFSSEPFTKARRLLSELWKGQDLRVLQSGIPRSSIDTLIEKTANARSIPLADLDEAILDVTLYLDEIAGCLDFAYCDYDVIDDRMGWYAKQFYCTYVSRIENLRDARLIPDLAKRLEAWAANKGGCA